ncbi:MAG: FAD-binding oxidoreductase [Candidatus Cloacimonetes bacterium]|nr:FAD-binding oxidoreductase [Candidatus Cloacimonadota bacterium]
MEIIKISGNELAEYLHDESRLSGNAEYLVFAKSEADIQDAVEFCLRRDICLTIQGSRTGITGGSVPAGGLILNLERMNKILGIRRDEAGSYFLRCEPGLKLAELREILFSRQYDISDWTAAAKIIWQEFINSGKYIFPPDPTETSASLGGMASCNASGARSYKYGATRLWLSNLKTYNLSAIKQDKLVPKPDITLPSKGVKNAAGYYLSESSRDFDLYIGAEGTLAIITELEIKLLPKPAHCWGVIQFFAGETAAVAFCEELKQQSYTASALEYFDHNALNLLRKYRQMWDTLPEMASNWKNAVYYEYEGDETELIEEAVFKAGDLAEKAGSSESNCWFADAEAGIQQLKNFRHAVPEAINAELDVIRQKDDRISKISTDLAVPAGYLHKMLRLYRQAEQDGWQVIAFGHIGNDHLHTNILVSDYQKWLSAKKLVIEWAKAAIAAGGSVSGEHGIGKIKRDLLQLMYGEKGIACFRSIKQQFDPDWILNRGNIIEREPVPGD